MTDVVSSENIELLKEVQGLDFYQLFFDEGIYEDGRELTEERPYLIKVGIDKNANGSSFVQAQGSVVSCRVTAKAGYYDPKQCIRFKYERANCIPKREFDFIRAVLNDFSRRHIFVTPETLVFDTEYQIQLFVTLTLNTCDGFLLGAVITAINAAFSDTQLPKMSVDLFDDDDDMDDDGLSKQVMRRRSKFRVDTTQMQKLKVVDTPHYSGFLLYYKEGSNDPTYLYDPNERLINLIRKRVDIVTGANDIVYFWQNATFEQVSQCEFRLQIVSLAKERREKWLKVFERVHQEGSADSETV